MSQKLVEIVKSKNLAYFPSRKVANTSIRLVLKDLAESPKDYWSSPDVPLSLLTKFYARNCYKIAVVRDPVKRFLSAYSNRILHHKDVVRNHGDKVINWAFNLEVTPEIDDFCGQFEKYYFLNDSIRRHFRLQRKYLGGNLGYFNKIYTIENLEELAIDLSNLAGKEISLPRLQTGGPKLILENLSTKTQSMILNYTRPDYEFLKSYYVAPKVGS